VVTTGGAFDLGAAFGATRGAELVPDRVVLVEGPPAVGTVVLGGVAAIERWKGIRGNSDRVLRARVQGYRPRSFLCRRVF